MQARYLKKSLKLCTRVKINDVSFIISGIGSKCETVDDCVFENAECEKVEVTIENEKHKDSDKDSEKYCKCKKNYVQIEENCFEEGMFK
jgi:hypothetical protein